MTNEQRALLADRIAQPDLAALGEGDAAAALNAPDPANGAKPVDVHVRDIENLLLNSLQWANVVIGSEREANAPLDVRKACLNLKRLVERGGTIGTTVEATFENVTTSLGHLLAGQIITQAVAEAMLALTTAPKAWWEANGFDRPITANDVGVLRAPQQEG